MNTQIYKKRFELYNSLELLNEWLTSRQDRNYDVKDKIRLNRVLEQKGTKAQKILTASARKKDMS